MPASMTIKDFLSPSNVESDLRVADKASLFRELAARAARTLGLPAQMIASELEKRDELGSTGIGGGVAIPHARYREVKATYGYLARLRQPIAFDAIDGRPVDIVFLLALPAAAQLEQLNALAAVSRKLRDGDVLQRMRSAADASELYRSIAE